MKEIKTPDGRHTIAVYESIEDMPCVRYHKFNQLLLQTSNIGCDQKAVNKKIGEIVNLIKNKQPEKAVLELKNLSHVFNFMREEVDATSQAFAVIVYSIDGVECSDLSQEGIEKTSVMLDKMFTVRQRDSIIDVVKKKFLRKIRCIFRRTKA